MLTIGQFSKTCQVTVKALRHYDRIGLLRPKYTDPATGYRYYEEAQMDDLLLIMRLKRYGFSLSEIAPFLGGEAQEALLYRIEEHKRALAKRIAEEQALFRELSEHQRSFERTGNIMAFQNQYTIETVERPEIPILSIRARMAVSEFGDFFSRIFSRAAKEHIVLGKETIAVYHDEFFNAQDCDIELAVSVQEAAQATRMLPGGLHAVTLHKGAYSGLPVAYAAIVRWIGENGFTIAGAPYEIYRKSHMDGVTVEDWETEIYFPIAKKEN